MATLHKDKSTLLHSYRCTVVVVSLLRCTVVVVSLLRPLQSSCMRVLRKNDDKPAKIDTSRLGFCFCRYATVLWD